MGVGALDLLNQSKRSGHSVADPGKTQKKKSSLPNTSLAAMDPARISSSLSRSGQELHQVRVTGAPSN